MNAETVNVPMNWKACAGILAVTLRNGNAQGVKIAREELQKMATAADMWNDNAAALVALVRASRLTANSLGLEGSHLRAALLPFAEMVK